MSKFDGEMEAAGEVRLDMAELIQLFRKEGLGTVDRNEAIACFLSAGEGWRDAGRALDGTFAGLLTGTRLMAGKEE